MRVGVVRVRVEVEARDGRVLPEPVRVDEAALLARELRVWHGGDDGAGGHGGLGALRVELRFKGGASVRLRYTVQPAQRQGVVERATQDLVTPCGLRTLAPDDPRYVGVYAGGLEGRDLAYHQGTVWPWLAGFYVEASLRAAPAAAEAGVADELLAWLEQLVSRELGRAGTDPVSEVFAGAPPHRPGGTFAQAWNTGELLRARRLCEAAAARGEAASS